MPHDENPERRNDADNEAASSWVVLELLWNAGELLVWLIGSVARGIAFLVGLVFSGT